MEIQFYSTYENAPRIYLVLDNTHFNAISNIDSFLHTMLNAKRVLCNTCQTIFSTPALKSTHTCSHDAPNEEPPKLRHDPITGLTPSTNRSKAQKWKRIL